MIAWIEARRAGLLGRAHWANNIVAGIIVGVVALPLSMAFAIATGVKPEQGIYTAIVASVIVAVAGGSRGQIAGPPAQPGRAASLGKITATRQQFTRLIYSRYVHLVTSRQDSTLTLIIHNTAQHYANKSAQKSTGHSLTARRVPGTTTM